MTVWNTVGFEVGNVAKGQFYFVIIQFYPSSIISPTLHTHITLILLMWRIGWANSIPIYIRQDATLHSLFISGNCSTYFGWYFHPSSGAHTTVSTAFGICHTVTAICRYRGRVGTGFSVLWVAYAINTVISKFWYRWTLCTYYFKARCLFPN
jgi:hypothetical protein